MPAPPRRAAIAASRAAPVIAGPPSTVTWPRLYLCPCACGSGSRHSPGSLRNARARTCASAAGGIPISASSTWPHRSRPGSSRWPGLRRQNVTVNSACGANPRTCPVAPSSPLGTSTATTRRAARNTSATAGSRSRDSPAPNTASITRSARAAAAAVNGARTPDQGRGRPARAATATGQPASCSRPAATTPSPPLLPGPHSTRVRHGRSRARTARSTARPALSMSVATGTPRLGAARSTSAISAGDSKSALSPPRQAIGSPPAVSRRNMAAICR